MVFNVRFCELWNTSLTAGGDVMLSRALSYPVLKGLKGEALNMAFFVTHDTAVHDFCFGRMKRQVRKRVHSIDEAFEGFCLRRSGLCLGREREGRGLKLRFRRASR